jgi:predicted dehydrogenase
VEVTDPSRFSFDEKRSHGRNTSGLQSFKSTTIRISTNTLMNLVSITTKRRGFLSTTGLATAAFAMPHIARGQDATVPKLRIGIVGCGGRSNVVGEMALKDGRFEITAVADYFKEAVDTQGEKYRVPADRRFTGLDCYHKMIEAGGFDVIAILTPPYFHPEQVEAAVEAGLHVWLAKPIAVDAPGVARIEAAARRATEKKRCFLVDFQTRSFAHYNEAARLVAQGDLGTLGFGEIEGTCPAFELRVPQTSQEAKLKNWLQWRDLCGESIIEYSIHAIDMASLMIGRNPLSATGWGGRFLLDKLPDPRPGDVRDHWVATYDYGDGFKVMFRGKRFDGHDLENHDGIYVKLHGSHGSLSADYSGEVVIRGEKSFYGDRFMKEKVRSIYNLGVANNWKTFHDNITRENFAQATVAPSVQSHYLAMLAREACYRGGPAVSWDEVVKSKTAFEFDTTGLKS